MNISKNEKVQEFLDELLKYKTESFNIITEIREIFLNTYPNTEEKIMYGGIVFYFDSEFYGGVFAYKKHISIEFSIGFLMNDPNKLLEGNGKYRRHLKIRSKDEILTKNVKSFIKQAIQTD